MVKWLVLRLLKGTASQIQANVAKEAMMRVTTPILEPVHRTKGGIQTIESIKERLVSKNKGTKE